MELRTIYFAKTFTDGHLKGCTVYCQITASDPSPWMLGKTGRDRFGSRCRWTITDAAFQKFTR